MTKSFNVDNVDSQDKEAIRHLVDELENVAPEELNDAVCDIIDLGGLSTSVLIESISDLTEETADAVVQKLEDFFYFYPEKGGKVVSKLKKAVQSATGRYKASLLAMLSDILEATDETGKEISTMSEEALAVLCSDVDIPRRSKAIEILSTAEEAKCIPYVIDLMINNLEGLDKFENYQFIETSLLALKKLGGDSVLRLLVNPFSDSAIKQLRIEWRAKEQQILNSTLIALQKIDTNFAQVMIKVVDLSEFNLPFAAMLKEGINHSDKWVRQAAVEAMNKTSENMTPEALARMLSDEAPEVRLMAVTSLGAFNKEDTGELLHDLASRPEESMDIRLNALYALYSQGNLNVLQEIGAQKDNVQISLNATGLATLLMPHDQGLHKMLEVYISTSESYLPEAAHYLSELALPEDIGAMVAVHTKGNENQRDKMIRFLKAFIEKNDGPRLEEAMKKQLSENEIHALKEMIPEHHHYDNGYECDCGHHDNHEHNCGCGHCH